MAEVSTDASDTEIKQILAAAKKRYHDLLPRTRIDRFYFVFKKRVKNCALVWMVPKPKYTNQEEGEAIILKKIGGNWVVESGGTDPSLMKLCPELHN